MEKSLVIIKPDAVRKKIIGEIITRFEKEDLTIEKLKMAKIDRKLACEHYCEHKDKNFFESLIKYITSDRTVIMVVSGKDAIKKVRSIIGPTDSKKAEKGTIRGGFWHRCNYKCGAWLRFSKKFQQGNKIIFWTKLVRPSIDLRN